MWLKITRQIAKPKKDACFIRRTAQQIIGREGETATLFGTSSVKSYVVAGGFAPRQLNRSVLSSNLRRELFDFVILNFTFKSLGKGAKLKSVLCVLTILYGFRAFLIK
jgi:hypothetical protein